jgi:hypothetical protein
MRRQQFEDLVGGTTDLYDIDASGFDDDENQRILADWVLLSEPKEERIRRFMEVVNLACEKGREDGWQDGWEKGQEEGFERGYRKRMSMELTYPRLVEELGGSE